LQPLGSIVWRILGSSDMNIMWSFIFSWFCYGFAKDLMESKGKYVSTNKEWGLKKFKT